MISGSSGSHWFIGCWVNWLTKRKQNNSISNEKIIVMDRLLKEIFLTCVTAVIASYFHFAD